MTIFTATAAFQPSHPHALAIYCSDGRFTEPVEELLRHLGHPRLDTLTLQGGPGLLNVLAAGFVDLDATKRATAFLVRGHALKEIVLIAHEGCGYYRARMIGQSAAKIDATQQNDLRLAKRMLEDAHTGVKIGLFYARIVAGRVRFDAVPP